MNAMVNKGLLLLSLTVWLTHAMNQNNQLSDIYVKSVDGIVIKIDKKIVSLFPTLITGLRDGFGTDEVPFPLAQFESRFIKKMIDIVFTDLENPSEIKSLLKKESDADLATLSMLAGYLGNEDIKSIIDIILHDRRLKKAQQYIISKRNISENAPNELVVSINNTRFTLNQKLLSYMTTLNDAFVGNDVVMEEVTLPLLDQYGKDAFAFLIQLIEQYDINKNDAEALDALLENKSIDYLVKLINLVDYLHVIPLLDRLQVTLSNMVKNKEELTQDECDALNGINPEILFSISELLFKDLEPFILKRQGFIKFTKGSRELPLAEKDRLLCFSTDGKRVFILKNKTNLQCIDLDSKKVINSLNDASFSYRFIFANQDGMHVAIVLKNNDVYMWDVANNSLKKLQFTMPEKSEIDYITVSPDGTKVAFVIIHQDTHVEWLLLFKGDNFSARTLIDPKDRLWVRTPIVWSLDSQYLVTTVDKHKHGVDEMIFVYNDMDELIKCTDYDGDDGALVTIDNHDFIIIDSASDMYLVTINQDDTLTITLIGRAGTDDGPSDIIVSNDKQLLLTKEGRNKRSIIRKKTGKVVYKDVSGSIEAFTSDNEGFWRKESDGIYKELFSLHNEFSNHIGSLSIEEVKFISDIIQSIVKQKRIFNQFTNVEKDFLLRNLSLKDINMLQGILEDLLRTIFRYPEAITIITIPSISDESSDKSDDESGIPSRYLHDFSGKEEQLADESTAGNSDESGDESSDKSDDESGIPSHYLHDFSGKEEQLADESTTENSDDDIDSRIEVEPTYQPLEKAFKKSQ